MHASSLDSMLMRLRLAVPMQDAMRFPLIGSAVLFSLFVLFKVLPKVSRKCCATVCQCSLHCIPLSTRMVSASAGEVTSAPLLQDLVNAVLTAYFVVLGTLALTATVLPAFEAVFPQRLRHQVAVALKDVRVPYLMKVRGSFTGCSRHALAHSDILRHNLRHRSFKRAAHRCTCSDHARYCEI